MKVYRHEPKGVRFFVLLAFSVLLLGLNVVILPGQEELPVKAFSLLFALGWLAVTVDSLLARIVVDEEGIGMVSFLSKRFVGWQEITGVNLGRRWVMGTFMPEHVIIDYKKEDGQTAAVTLHSDLKNWRELLGDIVLKAPPAAVSREVKTKI